jgi:hypothetical protein
MVPSSTGTNSILQWVNYAQNTQWTSLLGYNGYLQASTQFRAPSFYDSDNTAYYVDPASTSNFVGLTVSNTISGSINGNAATAGYILGTNIGRTGSNGFISTTGWGTADWANQPVSGLGMTITGTPGSPTTNYGFFNKFGNRDAGGPGWGGMWMEYDGGSMWYGATTVSTSYAAWKKVLDSGNYNSYAPTLTGGGASGTWGINVTGSSASCSGNAASVTINYNNNSNSTYQMLWGSGNGVYGTSEIYCNPSTDYLYAGSFYCGNWFRSSGTSGWYNETYACGIYGTSTQFIQTYNSSSFQVNNALYATGNITAYYSDKRLKDIKGNIPNALSKLLSLNGVYYTNNEIAKENGYTSDEVQVGVIAQEVAEVLPEVVKPAPFDIDRDEEGNQFSKSGENYVTVQYEKLIPLLIEAIKEQQLHIDKLDKDIEQLKLKG